jgi:hypothetical protein
MAEPIGVNAFTVPAGKSLYVEHITLGDTNGYVFYVHAFAEASIECKLTMGEPLTSFQPSMKLGAGRTLQVSSGLAILHALLVDTADVYAAVPCNIQSARLADIGTIEGVVGLSSPRPSIVNVEESVDVMNWLYSTNALVMRSSQPTQWNFTGASKDPTAFFRASARARRSQ